MNFSDMKISSRLAIAFGLVLTLSLGSAGYSLHAMADANADFKDTVLDKNVKIQLLNEMGSSVRMVQRVMRSVVILDDAEAKKAELAKIDKARAAYDKASDKFSGLKMSDAGKEFNTKIKAAQEAARPLNNKVVDLGMADKDAEARVLLFKEANPATDKWLELIEANIDRQEKRNADNFASAQADYSLAQQLLLGINLLCIGLAVGAAWLVTRSITSQLGAEPGVAVKLAQDVARGDLTTPIQLKAGDHDSMMAQFLAMQSSLASVVGKVRQNADSVATASAQIAQGNTDLSQRTEMQASALEETAASMEQLGSAVTNNADNARQANELATGASEVARQGGDVVREVVETMKGINTSSKKIADIIGVIDGIAFQTNILALNAAVEAARAGEQGRGFAVVASEVRNLAQRSADAAKEIKSLITASVEQVEQGTHLVDRAGSTMQEVVASIGRVSDIMGEISSASHEQSSGVRQVGEAVGQMDQATQQNAALVEESAAAAESLKQQAQQLVQAVSVFKVRHGHEADAGFAAAPLQTAAARPAATHRPPPKKAAPRHDKGATTAAKPAEPATEHASAATAEWESF